MTKKSYELFPPGTPAEKKGKSTSSLPSSLQQELEFLANKSDAEIDFSDIPELEFDRLGKPIIGGHFRPLKKPISLRIDTDVLEWFQTQPKYQTLINKICRLYYMKHKSHTH